SVGNPIFDRQAYPSLPDLPEAEREARAVATFYQDDTLLVGHTARKERLMNELSRVDVLHLACHYLVNERAPLRSKLLLATGDDVAGGSAADSSLTTAELFATKLRRPRLVVLSACQTNVEH